MKKQLNRRMFLKGSGGALLAIPFLPSLTTRAFAQEGPAPAVGRNFLAICSDHGDVWGANQYPSDAWLTETLDYAGRQARFANAGAGYADGRLRGRRTTAQVHRRAAKFMLGGLDIPSYRHHRGGQLGNFADVDAAFLPGVNYAAYQVATIDQVMAYSNGGIRLRISTVG